MMPLNAKVFAAAALCFGAVAIGSSVDVNLPGNHEGYAPGQPIAFSHRLHAGELKIDCLYCHYGARKSRTAGIPPASLCMNCHRTVTAGFDATAIERKDAETSGKEPRMLVSDEIRKLQNALGLDEEGTEIPGARKKPIEWVRVHNLPDFVAFDHSVHVAAGVSCQSCHGPVQTFERMRQHADLSMGWCIDCHRTLTVEDPRTKTHVHPTTDCAACHY